MCGHLLGGNVSGLVMSPCGQIDRADRYARIPQACGDEVQFCAFRVESAADIRPWHSAPLRAGHFPASLLPTLGITKRMRKASGWAERVKLSKLLCGLSRRGRLPGRQPGLAGIVPVPGGHGSIPRLLAGRAGLARCECSPAGMPACSRTSRNTRLCRRILGRSLPAGRRCVQCTAHRRDGRHRQPAQRVGHRW